MPKLSEHFDTPEKWIQRTLHLGMATCLIGGVFYQSRNGNMTGTCLAVGLMKDVMQQEHEQLTLLKDIIQEFYPERVPKDFRVHLSVLAYFNDHDDTTFEDIQRVVSEFDRRWMLLQSELPTEG